MIGGLLVIGTQSFLWTCPVYIGLDGDNHDDDTDDDDDADDDDDDDADANYEPNKSE